MPQLAQLRRVLPELNRETREKSRAGSGCFGVERSNHRYAKDVSLKLHQKIIARGAAIYAKLWSMGLSVGMANDCFTVRSLAAALNGARETVQSWVDRGLLEAKVETKGQRSRITISGDAFTRFCKQHGKLVVGNRLDRDRLEFVRNFVFAPSHVELLPVRESKKERAAYEAQIGPGDGDVNHDPASLTTQAGNAFGVSA